MQVAKVGSFPREPKRGEGLGTWCKSPCTPRCKQNLGLWRNWLAQGAHNTEVVGSSPTRPTIKIHYSGDTE